MSNSKRKPFMTTYQMVTTAVLAAVSAVLFLTLQIPIFGNIYKLDFSNVPVLLAAFSMGPLPAAICLLLKDLIHLVIKGFGSTAGIGDLADFLMTLALILPVSLIYTRQKNRKNALIGMLTGTVVMAAAALAVNAFIMFPFYMSAFHMDLPKIAGMLGQGPESGMLSILLATTLPFNLLKGVVLSVITFLIYKPLSPILHGKMGSRKSA